MFFKLKQPEAQTALQEHLEWQHAPVNGNERKVNICFRSLTSERFAFVFGSLTSEH